MSADADPTEELADRFQRGDNDALGELFDAYRERLKRMVHFRLDDRLQGRVSASDVIQEAFISAAERTEHYRDDLEMSPFLWFRLLVGQRLIDLHRKHLGAEMRDARREVSLGSPVGDHGTSRAIAAHLVGNQTSPSQACARVERILAVEAALNQMDAVDREVIALRHFEELSNAEVAEVLGISVQAASKRYVRAIRRMREILSRFPGLSAS